MKLTPSQTNCFFLRDREIDHNFNKYFAGLKLAELMRLKELLNDGVSCVSSEDITFACNHWSQFSYRTGQLLLKVSTLLAQQPKLNRLYRFAYLGLGHSTVRFHGNLRTDRLMYQMTMQLSCIETEGNVLIDHHTVID